MKIDRQTLALFAYSMASCLASGLSPDHALQVSGGGLRSKLMRQTLRDVRARVAQGVSIADALTPHRRVFPYHFLPVVVAGELSGRLVEAFEFLHGHYLRTEPTLRLMRNVWLYPLIIVVAGWLIRTGIYCYFERYAAAFSFLGGTLVHALGLALLVWASLQLPWVRRCFDGAVLQLPALRETELRLSTILFLATFRLVYQVGHSSVLSTFDLAAEAVRNSAIRRKLLPMRQVLERQGTFAEAFAQAGALDPGLRNSLANGALSGQLEQSLAAAVQSETVQLEEALRILNALFQGLVVFSVTLSIVETVLVCTR